MFTDTFFRNKIKINYELSTRYYIIKKQLYMKSKILEI